MAERPKVILSIFHKICQAPLRLDEGSIFGVPAVRSAEMSLVLGRHATNKHQTIRTNRMLADADY
jgi:hypothetical protein